MSGIPIDPDLGDLLVAAGAATAFAEALFEQRSTPMTRELVRIARLLASRTAVYAAGERRRIGQELRDTRIARLDAERAERLALGREMHGDGANLLDICAECRRRQDLCSGHGGI